MIIKERYTKPVAYLMLLSILLPLSPVFCHFLGVNGNIIFSLLLSLIILVRINKLRFTLERLLIVFYLIIFSVFFAIKWHEISLIYYPIYLLLSILVAYCINESVIICFIDLLSKVILLILIGAIAGFFYGFLGGRSLMEITNPDGRVAYLYLSTMTNWISGAVIRPSGIFDEPGTLSFITCAICSLRELYKLNRKVSWLLMSMGMITLSVAHVIYFVFFILSSKFSSKKLIIYSFGIIAFLATIVFIFQGSMLSQYIDSVFLSRFSIVNGRLEGDNRTELLLNAYSIINHGDFFWGTATCIFNIKECNLIYPPFGENILSPFALTGLFMSLPYYFVLLFLTISSIRYRSSAHIFGFMLLLTQRPNLFSYGYSLLIVIICLSLIRSSR